MDYWKERLGFGFLFAGLVALIALFGQIGNYYYLALFIAWLLLLAFEIRSGALPLVGPVLIYDMIRIGRRPANFRMRTLFALALAGLAAFQYYSLVDSRNYEYTGGAISLKSQAQIGQTLFNFVIVLQFLLIGVLTPGYVAGAIAEEKERKTLEFLLATDLRSHEIIFGKLASRVANLLMFVIAGLPVMGLALLFGGVDPNILMICYAITLITILSLSAVSIFASVRKTRARDSIGFAYAIVLFYIIASFVPFIIMEGPMSMTRSYDIFGYKFQPFEWANRFAAGNPLWQLVFFNFQTRSGMGGIPGINRGGYTILIEIFTNYALFHALIVVLCIGYSGWKLRVVALAQLYNPIQPRKWLRKFVPKEKAAPPHPPVGDNPMYWKEVHVMGSGRAKFRGWAGFALTLAICLLAPLFFVSTLGRRDFTDNVNVYTRLVGVVGIGLLLIRIAIRGAGCISGERDQHTLDELLTTPLTTREILTGKWIGCVVGMKAHWQFLILTWAVAVVYGALHIAMFPLLIACSAVYALAFAGLGLVCSLAARTTNRAILNSIVMGLFQGGLVVVVFYGFLSAFKTRDNDLYDFAAPFSPPISIFYLSMNDPSDQGYRNLKSIGRDSGPIIGGLIVSIFAWLALSFYYWVKLNHRFAKLANRLPYTPEVPTAERKRQNEPKA